MPNMWVDTAKNQSVFQMFLNTYVFYTEDLMTKAFLLFSQIYCVDTIVKYRKMVNFASILVEGELSEYFDKQI